MTVEEKINILVERYCRNRSHLAEMIGISPQAVNNWVYRDRIPRRGMDAILAHFPQIDREWLSGGSIPFSSGPLPLPDDEEEAGEEGENQIQNSKFLDSLEPRRTDKVRSKIQTASSSRDNRPLEGEQLGNNSDGSPKSSEGLFPLQFPRHDVKYVFQCHGDSMLPSIHDGDYVGVGEAIGRYEEFRKGVPYLIQTTDGRLMVKIVQDPGPTFPYLLLSTENPNYELADGGRLAKNEFYTAYRVIMVMRDI